MKRGAEKQLSKDDADEEEEEVCTVYGAYNVLKTCSKRAPASSKQTM